MPPNETTYPGTRRADNNPVTKPCLSCKRPMMFVRNQYNRWMPLEPEPVRNGNIVLMPDGTCIVLRLNEIPPDGASAARYISHHATCPHAADHRKPKQKG